jgi:uncharacterized membrane protein
MSRITTARWTLILGLAFIFLYFGIVKFTEPKAWIGWMPAWIDGLFSIDVNTWLKIIGATEIALGIMILVPVRFVQQLASILMTLHLTGIVWEVGWNDIAVRDIGLLLMATSVFYLL